jgi:hypothetical protein
MTPDPDDETPEPGSEEYPDCGPTDPWQTSGPNAP